MQSKKRKTKINALYNAVLSEHSKVCLYVYKTSHALMYVLEETAD
jgi:hypothetical protein